MKQHQFDLIVLGSGPAGSTVAMKIVEAGKSVAMIDSREFGGTCALRGCNPKKVYANAGAIIDLARRSEGKLIIRSVKMKIDWRQLLEFKKEFTEPVVNKKEKSFQDSGIETFHGAAKFVGQNQISVGNTVLPANHILVTTGATPTKIDIPGSEHITTSDDFLEIAELPEHVVFIGGGYISMEFAHVVARCGTKVTVIERENRALSGFDPDLVKQLVNYSKRNGIQFRFNAALAGIDADGDGTYRLSFNGAPSIDNVGLIVHGAGRMPNIGDLGLQTANVAHDRNGIAVDKTLKSPTNDHVYAAGDCAASGAPRLTPCANEEARIVVKNFLTPGSESHADYGAVPKVAFTTPAIAAVGLSEKEATRSSDVDVRADDTSSWGSVRKTGDAVAGYKLLIDKKTDQILGAHLLGPGAEETINLFAMAMKFNLTATDVKSTLFAFPTFASDVRSMV
ncbi:glutathione reductase (NADPH) [Rhodopirellula rubra]|uniref:Glutathione reductase (NADPH) n=1 Tax=Aporhodopirellula rubra TaxID=980271 RepID=A0A7W5H608_9BACT|nr:NAD(P)/FAD-dependent oxidoreductase [Aporhodopirellula rubra]MBB3206798.1 glutathione reductase (NADPH) [Aporhodopirellula rubra]